MNVSIKVERKGMGIFMSTKYLIATVVETIIKVVIIAVVIVFVFRGATQAYEFGYRVFADQPVSASGGRTITVSVEESASLKEIARMLEERGLIEDANLFMMQELLSAYHGKIIPGIYDLSTDMTAGQMLEIMATPVAQETDSAQSTSTPVAGEAQDTEGEQGTEPVGEEVPQDGGEQPESGE